MDISPAPQALDHAAFRRVWQRVMPQDRPDCPFTLDPPPDAPLPAPAARSPAVSLCLGGDSAGELAALDQLSAEVRAGLACYRALRGGAPLLRTKEAHSRRLAAARYLIAGEHPRPAPPQRAAGGPLLPLLRARYHAEQALVLRFFTAANSSADPCLAELYRALAVETQALADSLRSWLERVI